MVRYWIMIFLLLFLLKEDTSFGMDNIQNNSVQYHPQYNGEKDNRVFTGNVWKNDPEILFAGPKNIVKSEPQIIYITKEIPVEKIVYIDAENNDVKITETWCDDTKENCN
jgi:hypothetical protein